MPRPLAADLSAYWASGDQELASGVTRSSDVVEAAAGRKPRAIIQTASTISCTARGMNNKVCSVGAEGPPRRRVPAVRVVVPDKAHGHGRRTDKADQESVRLE